MACFGCGNCQLNRLQIAHLPHQDHVGVLAEGCAQGVGGAVGVLAYLPLVDKAAITFIDEFDRIFNGDDVLRTGIIDVI